MHVRTRCRMYPLQHRRLFLESRDLRVQRYSGKVEMKQSLHFEKDCFEYKEYTVREYSWCIYTHERVNAFGTTMPEHAISFYEDFLIKIIYEEVIKSTCKQRTRSFTGTLFKDTIQFQRYDLDIHYHEFWSLENVYDIILYVLQTDESTVRFKICSLLVFVIPVASSPMCASFFTICYTCTVPPH